MRERSASGRAWACLGGRVDIGWGKRGSRGDLSGGKGAGADRGGGDLEGVGRGRREANDVVREEKRQGVVESGGSRSARVPFGVAVTEDQGRVDRCERQAEKGRNTSKDIVVRGVPEK